MAEAVGLAASIIAIIDLSAKVALLCLNYSTAVGNARADITRLRSRLYGLGITLQGVQHLLDDPSSQALATSRSLVDSIDACTLELAQLHSRLDPGTARKAIRRLGIRALKWPFDSKEVGDIVSNLERYERTITLSLQIDQTTLLLDIRQRIEGVSLQPEEDAEFLAVLRSTDPSDDKMRIQRQKGGLLKDSSSWILDHSDFRRWRDDEQSRLLWIKGDPGKGKTMLLCGIVDQLEDLPADTRLLSYFFCQATDARLNNATSVLRGLLYRLLYQEPSLMSHVPKTYKHAGKQLFEDVNQWDALSKILMNILQDPSWQKTFLIIDALDECETNREQLLDLLIYLSSSSRAKLIVSSRNGPSIGKRLNAATQKLQLCLELNHESISAAIGRYIEYKVDQLAQSKKYDDKIRDAVQQHLASNANNTFLWVALVCQELADPKVRKWHTLAKLKSFPPGLDSLYQRMMKHIRDSDDADLCRQILAVASVVYRPVSLKELTFLIESLENLSDDLGALEDIIGSCGSLLTIREGVIYFVHQSAKDFMLNKAFDQILPSGIAHQHRAIFSRSLEALSRTLRRDIYSLRVPGFPIDKVSPPDPDPLALTRYSCIHWVDHLSDSDPAERMRDLQDGSIVHAFLKRKYLYWLEAVSLMRSMSEGVLAMQKLEALVGNTKSQQLTELLRDGCRFILSHKRAIETAPLQVYASALVFSPTRSLVRQIFMEEEPDWIMLKPIMEADWNACLATLGGHGGSVSLVAFSPNGQHLASGSDDRTVKLWLAATGTCLATLEGHGGWVSSVVFSPDGQHLASGSDDHTVKLWDVATGTCLATLEGHGGWVSSVVFSPDGQRLASGSDDRTVKLWDAAMGTCLATLEGHGGWVSSVVFLPNGQHLASGSDDCTIKLWDAAIGTCLTTLEGHGGWVSSVAFSPDGQRLASASGDYTIKLWDIVTGACVRTLEGHGDWVSSVVFSPNGQHLASGSDDRTIKLWLAATGTCLATLEGHSGWVSSVVFSPNGQYLASGSDDRTVKLWDAATDTCLTMLEGHGGWVSSVAFSPNGQWLVSASDDCTVKLWDTVTGACVRTLNIGRMLSAISFDATGSHLHTDIGTIALAIPPTLSTVPTIDLPHDLRRHGYGISSDGKWITREFENILRLPAEYRPSSSAVVMASSTVVAIGCASGRVLLMRFSVDEAATWPEDS